MNHLSLLSKEFWVRTQRERVLWLHWIGCYWRRSFWFTMTWMEQQISSSIIHPCFLINRLISAPPIQRYPLLLQTAKSVSRFFICFLRMRPYMPYSKDPTPIPTNWRHYIWIQCNLWIDRSLPPHYQHQPSPSINETTHNSTISSTPYCFHTSNPPTKHHDLNSPRYQNPPSCPSSPTFLPKIFVMRDNRVNVYECCIKMICCGNLCWSPFEMRYMPYWQSRTIDTVVSWPLTHTHSLPLTHTHSHSLPLTHTHSHSLTLSSSLSTLSMTKWSDV